MEIIETNTTIISDPDMTPVSPNPDPLKFNDLEGTSEGSNGTTVPVDGNNSDYDIVYGYEYWYTCKLVNELHH